MVTQPRLSALGSAKGRWGVSSVALGVALASLAVCGPVFAQAPGAGASPTPPTQPSAALPAQPEGSPGYQNQGYSGSGPNVTGTAPGAANTQGGGPAVQEVVVTARRVTENVQNVPLSVTAIGARQLDVLQVRQVTDLKSLIPDVSVQPTAVAGGGIIYIRGIPSQSLPNIALDNRVGIYLDGVYIAREEGQSFALSDIQQVEVLKGPQGTLFGKNVTGWRDQLHHPRSDGQVRRGRRGRVRRLQSSALQGDHQPARVRRLLHPLQLRLRRARRGHQKHGRGAPVRAALRSGDQHDLPLAADGEHARQPREPVGLRRGPLQGDQSPHRRLQVRLRPGLPVAEPGPVDRLCGHRGGMHRGVLFPGWPGQRLRHELHQLRPAGCERRCQSAEHRLQQVVVA